MLEKYNSLNNDFQSTGVVIRSDGSHDAVDCAVPTAEELGLTDWRLKQL